MYDRSTPAQSQATTQIDKPRAGKKQSKIWQQANPMIA